MRPLTDSERGPAPQNRRWQGSVVLNRRWADHEGFLQPFVTALRGNPVPYDDLVEAGRRLATIQIAQGKPVTLVTDGPWAGVWDLERLTDEEVVAWGMWAAAKLRSGLGRPF
jgi:hypothetical protein